jgi:hypothetical protein
MKAKNITNQRFGRLVALYPTEERRNGTIIWRLRCDCGREIESRIGPLGTRTKSCGCLRHENRYRHGSSTRNNVSPLYHCWRNIKEHCLNPKHPVFKHYGGRGISMAAEWINDFQAFRDYIDQHLGPRPKNCTIDRIDNDEGYYPGNLKWSTQSEQNYNQRRSKINKIINKLVLECLTECRRRRTTRPVKPKPFR